MTSAALEFWQDCKRYHDLAERYERNVEVTYPPKLGGRSGEYSCGCSYCATEVTYYEYRGPNP